VLTTLTDEIMMTRTTNSMTKTPITNSI